MNANKSMTLIGTAIVIAAIGSSGTASAGIDGSGFTVPKPTFKRSLRLARGSLSRFGSIYVNGVRYSTDTALFIIDGALGSENDLSVGRVVSVLGTVNDDGETGTAYLVTFEDLVDGPISTIDVETNSMTVMGQTVLVDAETVFDLAGVGSGIDGLAVNDLVEVSGYVDSHGRIVAASINTGDGSGEHDLTGRIEAVDGQAMRLAINGLLVDYSAAGLFGLDAASLREGDVVEVVGSGYSESGDFIASRIYAVDTGLAAIDDVEAEIEGLITAFHSLNEFDLGGTRVRLTWQTRYVNDWVFGLSADRRVKVTGELDAAGTLVADEIVFEKLAEERLAGSVDAVAGDYLVVSGRLVRVTPETKYKDESDARERRFNIGSVRTGDPVEISGYGSSDTLHATVLKRIDDNDGDDFEDDDSDDD